MRLSLFPSHCRRWTDEDVICFPNATKIKTRLKSLSVSCCQNCQKVKFQSAEWEATLGESGLTHSVESTSKKVMSWFTRPYSCTSLESGIDIEQGHTGLICSDSIQITTLTACITLKIQPL